VERSDTPKVSGAAAARVLETLCEFEYVPAALLVIS
jgi:hypothetical protein